MQQFNTKNNAIEDLTPYVTAANGLSAADIKDFYTSMWADGMLDGKRLMMPFSKSDIVLYYNPALLAKYGIMSPPEDMERLRRRLRQSDQDQQWACQPVVPDLSGRRVRLVRLGA